MRFETNTSSTLNFHSEGGRGQDFLTPFCPMCSAIWPLAMAPTMALTWTASRTPRTDVQARSYSTSLVQEEVETEQA
uniref:Uncharacterized protein n=1 Tax=Triticum urartu TaxID=4572 RepID=A0A8R7RAY3_TRIUA